MRSAPLAAGLIALAMSSCGEAPPVAVTPQQAAPAASASSAPPRADTGDTAVSATAASVTPAASATTAASAPGEDPRIQRGDLPAPRGGKPVAPVDVAWVATPTATPSEFNLALTLTARSSIPQLSAALRTDDASAAIAGASGGTWREVPLDGANDLLSRVTLRGAQARFVLEVRAQAGDLRSRAVVFVITRDGSPPTEPAEKPAGKVVTDPDTGESIILQPAQPGP